MQQEQALTRAEALPVLSGRARRSVLSSVGDFIRKKPLGALGAGILLTLVAVAIFAPWIAPYDHILQDVPNRLAPPGTQFWLGTDKLGRDLFSRIVFGARISLYVGLLSVAAGSGVGVILGVSSAYFGGWFDLLVQRVVDALLGFPSLVLALVLVVALKPSLEAVTIAIAISLSPRFTRLARSSALSVKEEMYVMAARATGSGSARIILRHMIPNTLAPVFVVATANLGTAIVAEAGLSFLGLGIPPPHPSWGGMMQDGARGYLEAAPWLAIFPGLALSTVVFSFSLFGDALRDVLDPRLRGA